MLNCDSPVTEYEVVLIGNCLRLHFNNTFEQRWEQGLGVADKKVDLLRVEALGQLDQEADVDRVEAALHYDLRAEQAVEGAEQKLSYEIVFECGLGLAFSFKQICYHSINMQLVSHGPTLQSSNQKCNLHVFHEFQLLLTPIFSANCACS